MGYYYRQGDVAFFPVACKPSLDMAPRSDGVIARGEKTGHTHRIGCLEDAELYDVGSGMMLSVTAEGGVSIVHEEHKKLPLPNGDYAVKIQRAYTPEEILKVID